MRLLKITTICAVLGGLTACESTKEVVEGTNGWYPWPLENVKGPVPGSAMSFEHNVKSHIYFDFDKSSVTADAAHDLDQQADWLKSYPSVDLVIEGHCDERGTVEYNLALGERRANAVKEYLMSKGIEAKRLHTVSYGKEKPEVKGSTKEAYAKNRVAISIVE